MLQWIWKWSIFLRKWFYLLWISSTLRYGIVGLYGSSIFNFLRKLHTGFCNGSTSLHSHSAWTLPFLHILTIICYFLFFFGNSHSNMYEVILHVVLICISLIIRTSSRAYWPSLYLLWKNVYSSPPSNFNLDYLGIFFVSQLYEFLVYFEYQILIR